MDSTTLTGQTVAIHHQLQAIAQPLSPALAEAIARNGPLSLPSRPSLSLAERLCRTIAGQQLSVKTARAIWERVLAAAQREDLIGYFAQADPQILRQCGLSAAKIKTLGEIAKAAQAGELDSEILVALPHPQRSQRLTAIWGVGPWSADMIGIFYCGDADIWPEGDLAARKTLTQLTSPQRKTLRTAARFAPYRSYLALHLWRYLDNP